jgi:nucleoside-diphosphate-sugar epimerase
MILLTGAGGVVGRTVTRQLLHEGRAVTVVTRGETRFPDTVRVAEGDLFSPYWLEATLDGVEAIQLSPRASGPGLGTLLQLARKQGVRRAVLLSATTVEHPAG